MKKIIKLTEKDIKIIAEKVINEQMEGQHVPAPAPVGVAPYPAPSKEQKDSISRIQQEVRKEMGIKTNPEIIEAKRKVRENLIQAHHWMRELLERSGVNRVNNNFEQDIEKVIQKFDHLYGDGTRVPKKKKEQ